LRVTHDHVAIWSVGPEPQRLAAHARADRRGRWMVDEMHWSGLPGAGGTAPSAGALIIELNRSPAQPVARRDLGLYDRAAAR
jgi:hypothetical protein